ncbi:MAG: FHA domain-containing protein [Phototrophicaceae bacterium]
MLHRIEHSIQQFVESIFSAVRGNHPFTDLLMHKLHEFVAQTDASAFNGLEALTIEIQIHADKYDELMIHQSDRVEELLEMVKKFLLQAFTIHCPLSIKLMPNWSLASEDLVIIQQATEATHHATRRMERPIETHSVIPLCHLICTDQTVYEITQPIINIGRGKENEFIIEDLTVSRDHAQLRVTPQQATLFDKHSQSGTFVNGKKIQQAVLTSGDVIKMGQTEFVFQKHLPTETTTSSFHMP